MPEQPQHLDVDESGASRRRYTRYSVYLDALLTLPGFGSQFCKIRDYCEGGMFLSWGDRPQADFSVRGGDEIFLEFKVPLPEGPQNFNLPAIIARVLEKGLGVSLVGECPEALAALQKLAVAQASAAAAAGRTASDQHGKLIGQCREIANHHFTSMAQEFFRQANQALFARAKETTDYAEQGGLLDMLPLLTRMQPRLQTQIIDKLLHGWDHPGQVQGAAKSKKKSEVNLSLMEKDEFEDLLAIADLVTRAENRFKDTLVQLKPRLGVLFGTDVDKGNDPIGAGAIFNAFAAGLAELGLKVPQRKALYEVMDQSVGRLLGALYDEVNERLKAGGILPVIEVVPRPAPRPPAQRRPPPAGQAEAGQGSSHVGAGRPEEWDERSAPRVGGWSPGQEGDPAQIAHTLHSLRRRLTPRRSYEDDSQPLGQTVPLNRNAYYEPADLLAGLTRLQEQLTQGGGARGGNAGTNLREQLTTALREHGGGNKQIAGPAGESLEMVGGMLSHIEADRLIADTTKTVVQQLQIPLLRTGLLDPGYLGARTHPARRLLNQIAEIQANCEGPRESALVRSFVEPLLARIQQEHETRPEVFADALSEVERFQGERDREAQENLQRIAAECEAQQEFLRARGQLPRPVVPPPPADAPPEIRNEWDLWLRKARRLHVHDRMRLDRGTGEPPQRLELAWIGEDQSQFVFADPQGRQAASIPLQEIAWLMRRGALRAVDENEPGMMDRAVQGVLYGMHEELESQALEDPVTGLPNRKRLVTHLEKALAAAGPDQPPQLLMLIRLGGLTPLQERGGPRLVERLLQQIGQFLKSQLPEGTFLARASETDFGAVLSHCPIARGESDAEQLLERLGKRRARFQGQVFPISSRLGLVALGDSGKDAEEVIGAAESTCLSAALEGENGISVFEPVDLGFGGPSAAVDWPAWLNRVATAETLEIRARPVTRIHAEAEEAEGPLFQTLSLGMLDEAGRWREPEEVLQGQEYAERFQAIDRRLIAAAIQWLDAQKERLDPLGGAEIRLSAHVLGDEGLFDLILGTLYETAVPPGRICFSLAESAVVRHLDQAEQLIRTLREFGCRFTIRGFGRAETGRDYLGRIPADYLEVDGLFVREIDSNANDHAIVRSMCEIGHLVGKRIIASGVDRPAVLALLPEVGADYALGDAVAAPVPLSEV
jgi:EAL domain-containing protein (putative c-di-GMP-specific phosphodiesterase class I)/GGDEF domain-containing protein